MAVWGGLKNSCEKKTVVTAAVQPLWHQCFYGNSCLLHCFELSIDQTRTNTISKTCYFTVWQFTIGTHNITVYFKPQGTNLADSYSRILTEVNNGSLIVSDMSTRVTTPLFTVTLKMKTTPEMVEQSCGKNVLNDTVEPVYHSVLPFLWSSSSMRWDTSLLFKVVWTVFLVTKSIWTQNSSNMARKYS